MTIGTPRANKSTKDILPTDLPSSLSWRPEDVPASLDAMYLHVVLRANNTILWYLQSKRSKRIWARVLRVAAVLLVTLAGILPILSQIGAASGRTLEPAWATVALAIAVALILLDRFFGFSTGWSRYVATEFAIQSALDQFRIEWQKILAKHPGAPVPSDTIQELLGLVGDFSRNLDTQVEKETAAWTSEFYESLSRIEGEAGKGGTMGGPRSSADT